MPLLFNARRSIGFKRFCNAAFDVDIEMTIGQHEVAHF
jgi:hypothetical protein